MPDNSHRYRLYEPVLFLHSSRASQGDAGCSEFHSTHGGFDGPYGIKVKIEARAQEGRARESQGDEAALRRRQQPGEERQARHCQAAWPAGSEAQDGAEGKAGAQEGRAQIGAEGGREDPGESAGHDAGDVVRADAAALAAAHGAQAGGPADVASAAAPGRTAIAAAAAVAVFRLEFVVFALLGNQAFRGLVVDTAEAARQQLGRRLER